MEPVWELCGPAMDPPLGDRPEIYKLESGTLAIASCQVCMVGIPAAISEESKCEKIIRRDRQWTVSYRNSSLEPSA